MKINIKNLLFQPLALHLATDGEGLHLSARECKEILAEHVSEEIERAAARGFVSLAGIARSTQPDPRVGMPDGEPCPEPSRRDVTEPAAADSESVARPRRRRER